jgi:hypothetical protein
MARKLAVIMHAMWSNGTCYSGDAQASAEELALRAKEESAEPFGQACRDAGRVSCATASVAQSPTRSNR